MQLAITLAADGADGVEEFIACQSVVQDENDVTLQVVARGCLDTVPTAFLAGTRVWFVSHGSQIVNIRGPAPPTVNVHDDIRFRPYNNQSEFPFTSCPDGILVAPESTWDLELCRLR